MTQSNEPNNLPRFNDSTVTQSQHSTGHPTQNLPEVGKAWGKFLIEKQLGVGGQAWVFQAYDQEGIAGHVALKVPRKAVLPEQVAKWKETEAKPLLRLDHPRIIKIMDAGVIDNIPYIATKLTDALPLDEYIKTREPPLHQIKKWMVQLAEAIDIAHQNGVIHRDIKPKNILITQEGEPLIIDFGIAGVVSAYEGEIKNGSSGSPAFMAPEQARGEAQADHRVDIFGLGVVLKYLLERKWPYEGHANPIEAAQNNKVLFAEENVVSSQRRKLARIANQALAPDPAKRFSTASHMVRVLKGGRSQKILIGLSIAIAVIISVIGIRNLIPTHQSPSENDWTSVPVTICFYEEKVIGSSPDSLRGIRLANQLIQELIRDQEYKVVERMELDKILKEYELIHKGHADPARAIRLGKLLSSFVIVIPTIEVDQDKIKITLQVTGTETSKILGMATEEATGIIDSDTIIHLKEKLYKVLQNAFPIRGLIEKVNSTSVELNIGSEVRVRQDTVFRVLSEGENPKEIALLTITKVHENSSIAQIVQNHQSLRRGLRVEAK